MAIRPLVRDAKGTPDPRLIVVQGQPVSSKGGTFYLDFKENGNRRQIAVGTNARDALEAWRTKLAQLTGLIESDPETDGVPDAGLTIDQAIENYLTEVEATKGIRTFRQYRRELAWFRCHCHKRYVSELNRGDAMRLFVQGRKEIADGKPLNQKTINRRVISASPPCGTFARISSLHLSTTQSASRLQPEFCSRSSDCF